MQNSIPTGTYETRDLWLAAALLASGHRLAGLIWQDRRAYFSFEDAAQCRRSTDAYWTRELRVAAKDFSDSLRTLKDRLHGDEASSPRGHER